MKIINEKKEKSALDYVEELFLQLKEYIEKTSTKKIKYEILRNQWFDIFKKYCEYWGWNLNSIETMFSFGEDGHNWELLWFPPKNAKEEKEDKKDSRYQKNDYLDQYIGKTLKKELDNFIGELEYCYDRMSIDRLLRTHWLFNVVCNHYFKDEKNKFLYPSLYK